MDWYYATILSDCFQCTYHLYNYKLITTKIRLKIYNCTSANLSDYIFMQTFFKIRIVLFSNMYRYTIYDFDNFKLSRISFYMLKFVITKVS